MTTPEPSGYPQHDCISQSREAGVMRQHAMRAIAIDDFGDPPASRAGACGLARSRPPRGQPVRPAAHPHRRWEGRGRAVSRARREAGPAGPVLELWPALPDAAQRIGTSHLEVLEAATDAAAAAGDDERDRVSCRPDRRLGAAERGTDRSGGRTQVSPFGASSAWRAHRRPTGHREHSAGLVCGASYRRRHWSGW